MRRSKPLFIALVFAVMAGCQPVTTKTPTEDSAPSDTAAAQVLSLPESDTLDQYFDELFKAGKFSGVALFARNGAIHTLAKGYRSFDDRDSLSIEDQFQLASVSKPFTAYGLLLLIQDGKVRMDAPVSTYLEGSGYNDVTIEQLLSHQSGIGYYAYVTDSLWGYPELYMSNDDLLHMIECREIPRPFQPGDVFDYCNTNYAIIASIIEKVSGMNFGDYMSERVFRPLGMDRSEIVNSFQKDATKYMVQGHYPSGRQKLPYYLDGIVGDKGMYSNVHDLYKFYMEYKKGSYLGDSLWREATSPRIRYARNSYYGFGWRVRPMPDQNDTMVYHNGWWRGFRTYLWMSKHQDKCAIVLTNAIRGGYLSQDEIWLMF